ncbi:MAG: asparagine synthetase B, partial [Kiritimatiellae bacterium]|nr:asparagine synthetase B [Kiritimatiellia bacterium]
MCGIAGLWRFKDRDPDDTQRLVRMASTLDHRGPDDRGYLFLETATGQHRLTRDEETGQAANLLLAHRRLSIIDVSTDGWQP